MKEKRDKNRYRYLLNLTTLTIKEFMQLLSCFDPVWENYYRTHDLQGQTRRLPKHQEHRSMSLKGSQEKLLFVLVYLSENPSQHYHATLFEMSQSKVSHGVARRWLKLLFPLLEETLSHLKVLPVRTTQKLYYTLKAMAGYFILLDATERPIPRSVVNERQRYFYSGRRVCTQ